MSMDMADDARIFCSSNACRVCSACASMRAWTLCLFFMSLVASEMTRFLHFVLVSHHAPSTGSVCVPDSAYVGFGATEAWRDRCVTCAVGDSMFVAVTPALMGETDGEPDCRREVLASMY